MTAQERADIERCLRRLGLSPGAMDRVVGSLAEAARVYRCRCGQRARSPRIAMVVEQLEELERAAERACSRGDFVLPAKILPETIDALVGRYPFSNLDLAPVSIEVLTGKLNGSGSARTAVVSASVELHVLDAAMRQAADLPHLVAARVTQFPFAEALSYFYGDCSDPTEAILRQRLEGFIVKMPGLASRFIALVHDRVRRATRDPQRRNPGRRTLYRWAEPAPDASLVFDVCEIILESRIERPPASVQRILIELVDLLRAVGTAEYLRGDRDAIRQDVFSSMLTIWVGLNQHRFVRSFLSAVLDSDLETAGLRRRYRRVRMLAIKCDGAIADSAAELLRRARMGDVHGARDSWWDKSGQIRGTAASARATGRPPATIELSNVVGIDSMHRCIRSLARACHFR
jgi:hypothetical protein